MQWEQMIINMGGGGVVLGAVLASLRSKKVRTIAGRLFAEDSELKGSLESLRSVVEAQGESIEWLRGELDRTRNELDQARIQLRETENLKIENIQLRIRVAELENHVIRLEEKLRLYREEDK
jgi:predicted RNase H-like nuclease (RuvC/YqgF family)